MKKLFFWLLITFFSSPLIAQQESSLPWYDNFFTRLGTHESISQALSRAEAAHEMNDLKTEAFARKEAGMLYLTVLHAYDSAMDCFIASLSIEDSLALNREKIFTYLAISEVLSEVGNYFKSQEALQQSLNLNHPHDDKSILIYILLKEGKLNAALGQIDAAFDSYENALTHQDELDDLAIKSDLLYERAILLSRQGRYEEALKDHKDALAMRRKTNDKRKQATSHNAIGELYSLMKNPEKALANHVVALEYWHALKDQEGIAASYNYAGIVYYEQKNYERAVANLQLALAAGRDAQSQYEMKKSYEFLSLCFNGLGDYKQSLAYKDSFIAISEFIQNEMNQEKVLEVQNRYAIDIRETQIDKLNTIRARKDRELAQEKRFRNFLVAFIGLGVIIVGLILYLYLTKRKSNRILRIAHQTVKDQNAQLQALNATKDKFFSIISHDLKGPLNSLTSFSSLLINHTETLSKDEIRMLAKDLDKSLKNLFELLENLLEWSRSQTGNIEFTPELFDVNALTRQNRDLLLVQAQAKNITLEVAAAEPLMVSAHKNSINTVIRNLMSNAIKFTQPGGVIRIRTSSQRGNAIVSISDSGIGMTKEILDKLFRIDTKLTTKGTADEKGTGLGLILCKDFVEKNSGAIWVESEPGKGSVFSFSLPAPQPIPVIKAEFEKV